MQFADPLAEAMKKAKGMARRAAAPSQSTSRSISPKQGRSRSPKFDDSICSFCESEASAVSISKSLTKTSIPLCLIHYYTTRSCRIDPQKVSIINKEELKNQLPYVQDLFAEAFTDLQKEIATESAKSFNEMSRRTADPLSILNDHNQRKPKANIAKKPRSSSTKAGLVDDGGFIKQINRREIDLIEQQRTRVTLSSSFANSERNEQLSLPKSQHDVNPYKRRKVSGKSSWHLVLDGKMNMENIQETLSSFDKKCKCGGDAVMFGNTTSLNNDVAKADTWGMSRDHDVSERYQCQECGKVWNENE